MDFPRVFIGTDLRQPLALNVLTHSIHVTAMKPVSVMPLYRHQLPIKRFGLTDFTFSRYLVPWLCNYQGTALFLDADMLVCEDINGLWDWLEDTYDFVARPAVSVVQDQPRFEWPSMMLFDNQQCQMLTPEYVNSQKTSPQDLHWATNIGAIPQAWNCLVQASEPGKLVPEDAKVLHFSEGLPCFFETQDTPGAAMWHRMRKEMNATVGWKELMGKSIHAEPVLKQLIRGYTE